MASAFDSGAAPSSEAGQKLGAEEDLHARLVNALGGIVWEADGRSLQFSFVSPRAETILGYPAARWLEEPDFFRAHIHPDDVELCSAFSARTPAHGQNQEFEYRMIAADGRVVWLHDIVSVKVAEDGTVRLRGIMVDVTERKRVAQALDERLRFETMLTELSAAFAKVPPDGVDREVDRWLQRLVEFLDVDRATFFRISGDPPIVHRSHSYTRPGIAPLPMVTMDDELPWITEQLRLGETVRWSRIPADVPPEARAEREYALRVGPKSALIIPVAIGGSVICALAFTALRASREWPTELVPRLRLVGEVFANVLIRKRADEAMRDSEARFRDIADSVPALIYIIGPDAKLSFVNKTLLDFHGLTREQFSRVRPTDPLHPDDRPRGYDAFIAAFEARRSFTAEFRMRRADGEYRWVLNTTVPRFSVDGEFLGYIGSCVDITERKHVEQQWRATSEQLRALSARLHAARENERTRIAREIHDELGSALASLRWDLDAVETICAGGSTEARLSELGVRAAAMISLVDETVNTVRRIASELRPSILDDIGLAAAVEWQAQQFQARTGIVCEVACSVDNALLSREQSTATFRILQEALTNVLRHAQATRVGVALKEHAGELVVTVRDDGKGITDAEKSAPKSLGLLGMRERARLVGGTIDIAGTAGNGTTVELRLPLGSERT